jgi:hypothetical protein
MNLCDQESGKVTGTASDIQPRELVGNYVHVAGDGTTFEVAACTASAEGEGLTGTNVDGNADLEVLSTPKNGPIGEDINAEEGR